MQRYEYFSDCKLESVKYENRVKLLIIRKFLSNIFSLLHWWVTEWPGIKKKPKSKHFHSKSV